MQYHPTALLHIQNHIQLYMKIVAKVQILNVHTLAYALFVVPDCLGDGVLGIKVLHSQGFSSKVGTGYNIKPPGSCFSSGS